MAIYFFYPKSCPMFCNVSKINFPIFIFFWDIVDFVLRILSEFGIKDFCEPDSEKLTNDTHKPAG